MPATQSRTILITGASSGIGLSAAEIMRERGWRVFATARDDNDLAMLEALGVEALYLDYTDDDSVHACAETVLARTEGRIDALFNNGAYAQPGAIEDLSTEAWRAQFDANFFGWHTLTKALVPAMREQKSGRIIQCSSMLGLTGMKFRGAYVATKFALEGYSDVLRMELAGTGIHVSLIEPGPIRTKFVETAAKHFRANVDINYSPHREYYMKRLRALEKGGAQTFKLEPETVVAKLIHACEAKRPRSRYLVTKPAYAAAFFRRFLPTRLADKILIRIADSGS